MKCVDVKEKVLNTIQFNPKMIDYNSGKKKPQNIQGLL